MTKENILELIDEQIKITNDNINLYGICEADENLITVLEYCKATLEGENNDF